MPYSTIDRGEIFASALQILRSRLGRGEDTTTAQTRRAIADTLAGRFPVAGGVTPTDRATLGRIIEQAAFSHDVGYNINNTGDVRGTLQQLNVDPTIEDTGPRVRYRVVVWTTDGFAGRGEMRVLVDSERPLTENEIRQAAIDEYRNQTPDRMHASGASDYGAPGHSYDAVIIGAGKRR